MDSFELNKIIGAILGTLLFVMGAGFLAEAIYAPREGAGPGYELPEPEGTGGEVIEAPVLDLGTLLASADVSLGERATVKCKGCHNFEEGAGNKQGPALFGVVGREIASHAGFTYSTTLEAHAPDPWTYENLSAFLTAPKAFAENTKMNFGGLKNDAERANLIAYLASISPGAPAFPPPAPPADATAEAAAIAPAAEGEAATATGADAVATPTTTQGETAVEGTPTTSGAEGAAAPTDAAPAASEAAPATTAH